MTCPCIGEVVSSCSLGTQGAHLKNHSHPDQRWLQVLRFWNCDHALRVFLHAGLPLHLLQHRFILCDGERCDAAHQRCPVSIHICLWRLLHKADCNMLVTELATGISHLRSQASDCHGSTA